MSSITDWLLAHCIQVNTNIKPGLRRIKSCLSKLHYQFKGHVIAVGGTNGKGSCVATLSTLFQSMGLKVCTFTSPHLLELNERFRINDQPINNHDLVEACKSILNQFDSFDLTFFECITLVAWVLFCEETPDVMIFEVGMGGRLDAVNALPITTSIITSISIDHEAHLGHTRWEINQEKLGIARPKLPLIYTEQHITDQMQLDLNATCAEVMQLDEQFNVSYVDDQFMFRVFESVVKVSQLNLNEYATLAALGCVKKLYPVQFQEIHFKEVLSRIKLDGRYQCIHQHPKIWVDVAHNTASIESLMQRWPFSAENSVFVVAFKKGKSVFELIPEIASKANQVIYVDTEQTEYVDAQVFIEKVPKGRHYRVVREEELKTMLQSIDASVLVFGCFKVVEIAMRALGNQTDVA